MEVAGTQLLGSGQAKACSTHGALDLGGACFKHGEVIVGATTACLRARLGTAPIRSRERQRADAQLPMTFCLACPFSKKLNLAVQFTLSFAASRVRRPHP